MKGVTPGLGAGVTRALSVRPRDTAQLLCISASFSPTEGLQLNSLRPQPALMCQDLNVCCRMKFRKAEGKAWFSSSLLPWPSSCPGKHDSENTEGTVTAVLMTCSSIRQKTVFSRRAVVLLMMVTLGLTNTEEVNQPQKLPLTKTSQKIKLFLKKQTKKSSPK